MSITEPEDAAVNVGSWLRNLGLEQYEAAFRENGVKARSYAISPRTISRNSALPLWATGANCW